MVTLTATTHPALFHVVSLVQAYGDNGKPIYAGAYALKPGTYDLAALDAECAPLTQEQREALACGEEELLATFGVKPSAALVTFLDDFYDGII
jgi:hypothetical protein